MQGVQYVPYYVRYVQPYRISNLIMRIIITCKVCHDLLEFVINIRQSIKINVLSNYTMKMHYSVETLRKIRVIL